MPTRRRGSPLVTIGDRMGSARCPWVDGQLATPLSLLKGVWHWGEVRGTKEVHHKCALQNLIRGKGATASSERGTCVHFGRLGLGQPVYRGRYVIRLCHLIFADDKQHRGIFINKNQSLEVKKRRQCQQCNVSKTTSTSSPAVSKETMPPAKRSGNNGTAHFQLRLKSSYTAFPSTFIPSYFLVHLQKTLIFHR
ncbi:hypothetical protein J6590_058617 [Homalodisca vitripennis]|nr:hypothetical protein J6590_058617 [Homalodisca vitripennis]